MSGCVVAVLSCHCIHKLFHSAIYIISLQLWVILAENFTLLFVYRVRICFNINVGSKTTCAIHCADGRPAETTQFQLRLLAPKVYLCTWIGITFLHWRSKQKPDGGPYPSKRTPVKISAGSPRLLLPLQTISIVLSESLFSRSA